MRARKSWRKKFKQEKRALYLQGLMDARDCRLRRRAWRRSVHYDRGYEEGCRWFPRSESSAPAPAGLDKVSSGLDEIQQGMEKFAEWLVGAMSGRVSQ